MGAHAAGHTGRRYRELYGVRHVLGRITGLDPAGPKYTGTKPDDKLGKMTGKNEPPGALKIRSMRFA